MAPLKNMSAPLFQFIETKKRNALHSIQFIVVSKREKWELKGWLGTNFEMEIDI